MTDLIIILMVDDDEDDCILVKEAFSAARLNFEITCLTAGEELLDYLYRRDRYADPGSSPAPDLILLDLNMPGMNGLEVLNKLKTEADFKCIPVIVLTTSNEEMDILKSYHFGANSFITKPMTFSALVDAIRHLGTYWFETARVPSGKILVDDKEKKHPPGFSSQE